MEIVREVTFYPIRPTEKGLIGFVSCLFDNKLHLDSIAIYTTLEGDIRLVFPNKVLPNSKEISLFYPIDNATYGLIKEAVVKKMEELSRKSSKKDKHG